MKWETTFLNFFQMAAAVLETRLKNLEGELKELRGVMEETTQALKRKKEGVSEEGDIPQDMLREILRAKAEEQLNLSANVKKLKTELAAARAQQNSNAPPQASSSSSTTTTSSSVQAPKQTTLNFVRHLANGKHETVESKFVCDTAPDSCVCPGCHKTFKTPQGVTGHQPHCPQFRTLEAERRASRLTFEVRASTARALVQEEAVSLDDASDGGGSVETRAQAENVNEAGQPAPKPKSDRRGAPKRTTYTLLFKWRVLAFLDTKPKHGGIVAAADR